MEDIMDNIMDDIMEDITEDIMEDIVELVDGFNLEICGLQILDMYLIICVFEFNKKMIHLGHAAGWVQDQPSPNH